MKNVIILVLTLIVVALSSIVYEYGTLIDFWQRRAIFAERVINQVEEDNENYVLDVLSETDAYQDWLIIKEK